MRRVGWKNGEKEGGEQGRSLWQRGNPLLTGVFLFYLEKIQNEEQSYLALYHWLQVFAGRSWKGVREKPPPRKGELCLTARVAGFRKRKWTSMCCLCWFSDLLMCEQTLCSLGGRHKNASTPHMCTFSHHFHLGRYRYDVRCHCQWISGSQQLDLWRVICY